MLERESWGQGWRVTFQPSPQARLVLLVPAAFLGLWLTGWLFGECFTGWAWLELLRERIATGQASSTVPGIHLTIRGMDGNGMLVFLSLFLFGWTIAGIAALRLFALLAFGGIALGWDATGLDFALRLGPMNQRRRVPWSEITAIAFDERAELRITSKGGSWPVPGIPEATDREQLADWLEETRAAAGATAPGATAPVA